MIPLAQFPHIAQLTRINAVRNAYSQLKLRNTTPGDPLHGKLNVNLVYFTGESYGGETLQCMVNGCGPFVNIPKVTDVPITFANLGDPTGNAYLAASSFNGYSQPQITVQTESVGGTFSADIRGWEMNNVPQGKANSWLHLERTTHQMIASPDGCRMSNISVKHDFYPNVEQYIGPPHGANGGCNFWHYPNQTAYSFCAPAVLGPQGALLNGFSDPARPMLDVQTVQDLEFLVDKLATTGVALNSQSLLNELFKLVTWEFLQNLTYGSPSRAPYKYMSNINNVGNMTWNNNIVVGVPDQFWAGIAWNNVDYLSYSSSTFSGFVNFWAPGGFNPNGKDCINWVTNTPCVFYGYPSTRLNFQNGVNEPSIVIIQPPRYLLPQSVCPHGDC